MSEKQPPDDPGYCGLYPAETGPKDPFWWTVCRPHDKRFIALRAGNPIASEWVTARDFVEGCIKLAGQSAVNLITQPTWEDAYVLAFWPVYAFFGGFGGMERWQQLELRMHPKINDGLGDEM